MLHAAYHRAVALQQEKRGTAHRAGPCDEPNVARTWRVSLRRSGHKRLVTLGISPQILAERLGRMPGQL